MSFVRGSNSALSPSNFFFSSSSSISRPSFVVLFLLAIKLLELLHGILIHGIYHIENFETLLTEGLKERRRGDCGDALTCDVIDIVLTLLHAIHILLKADLLITRLGGVIAHELCNLGSVGGILMDAQLDVL